MFAILSVLSILLTLASPPSWENPVPLVWPFADGVIRSVDIGYGDWATSSEGPHPGIDFGADDDDCIRNPLSTGAYIIGQWPSLAYQYPGIEGSLVFAPNLPGTSNWGWQYDHIKREELNWDQFTPGTYYSYGHVFDLQTNPDHLIFQHLHVYWMWVWKTYAFTGSGEWVPGSMYPGSSTTPKRGYINPFEYLPAEDLQGYDYVRFGRVFVDHSQKGIWFSPDGAEMPGDFSLVVTPAEFQDEIFGVVDFAAAPYSAFDDDPNMDNCGVYSVGHKLAWMNPYTGKIDPVYYDNTSLFESVLEVESRDYYRTLVEMSGDLPYEPDLTNPADTDEYRAVFLDGELVGDPGCDGRIDERWFNSAYILSNCGNLDVGPDGWENIPLFNNAICQHFWSSNVMCVGGWDTRLRRGDRGGNEGNEQAPVSQYALFPDGKYMVDVTASSQGTAFLDPSYQSSRSKYLPSQNVDDPNSDPDPVVVDNHIPYVDSIIVYSTTQLSFPRVVPIYTAGWKENTEADTAQLISQAHGYLPINDYTANLWIAIRYSEPMNAEPGDVWITGENRGINIWNSCQNGIFRPEPVISNWPEEFGQLETGRLADGVWHLYKYKGSVPSEYKGRLTIHISASDYGGNSVDSDPSTIATPRDADGAWNGLQLFDEEPDASYTWGACCWRAVADYENETGYYAAMVGYTEVNRVTFTEMGHYFNLYPINNFYTVNIPYNNGCYAIWIGGYLSAGIYRTGERLIGVVDGEGDIIGSMEGPDAAYDVYFEMDTWLKPGYEGNVEWENNHLWYRERAVWNFPVPQNQLSNETWYVINGHTGADYAISAKTIIGEYSEAWYDTEQYYYVNCNNPEPTFTVNGCSTPVYYIERNNPVPYYMEDIFIQAPANDRTVFLQPQDIELTELSTFQYTFNLEFVFPNPVASFATISYSLADAGEYTLTVYDLSGRKISTLVEGNVLSGNHSYGWDTSDDSGNMIPNGIYYVKLEGCGESAVQNVVVLH